MSRIAVVLILLASVTARAVPSCGDRVAVFNSYEVLVHGHMENRYSVFKIGPWSDQTTFEGLVVKADDQADTLRFGDKSLVLKPWFGDKKYNWADNFNPADDTLNLNAEAYSIKLLKKDKVLCQDSYAIEKSE